MPSAKRQRQREARQARAAAEQADQRRASRRRAMFAGFFVAAAALLGARLLTGGGGEPSADENRASRSSPTTHTTPPTTVAGPRPAAVAPVPPGARVDGPTPCPKPDGSSPRTTTFAQAPPLCIDPAKRYTAAFDTTEGKIEVALDARGTPGTVSNFVVLSRYHYYDGSAVHRTDPSIDIIQGGSPGTQSASDPGPGYTIKDEGSPPRRYTEGDLVMARTAGPDSAGAQFFFVAGPKASALDVQGTYVTFGKVTQGLDVVKRILALHVPYPPDDPKSGLGGGPSKPVVVNRVTIAES